MAEDPNITNELWGELEIALDVTGRVIDAVARAIEDGRLDYLLGHFPPPNRTSHEAVVADLKEEVLKSLEPRSWDTLDEVERRYEDDLSLPEGAVLPGWLVLIVSALLDVLRVPSTGAIRPPFGSQRGHRLPRIVPDGALWRL